jgi:hypothetical protein
MASTRCAATSKTTGKKCKNNRTDDSEYCATHKVIHEKEITQATNGDGWEDLFNDDESLSHISLPMVIPEPVQVHAAPPPPPPMPVENPDIDALSAMMNDLSVRLIKLKRMKKVMSNFEIEVEHKARSFFYHQNKNNPTILSEIRTKLQSVNLYLVKQNKEIIPYQFVREYTDQTFERLAPEQKRIYIDEARKVLRQKTMICA